MKKVITGLLLVSTVASAQNSNQQANTSTTTVAEQAPVAAKKLSVSFTSMADINAAESRIAEAGISTENTLALSYKLKPKTSIGLSNMFNMLKAGVDTKDEDRESFAQNSIQNATTAVSLTQTMNPILGSDEWALIPALTFVSGKGSSVGSLIGADIKQHLQVTASIGWTLSPKISLGLTEQFRSYFNSNSTVSERVSHRILNTGNATYNINDKVSIYQSIGTITGFRDRYEMRRTRDRAYLETGVNINPIKQVSLNLNINQDAQISSAGDTPTQTSNFVLYRPHSTGPDLDDSVVQYEFSANISF